jgi:hypothetical protein
MPMPLLPQPQNKQPKQQDSKSEIHSTFSARWLQVQFRLVTANGHDDRDSPYRS